MRLSAIEKETPFRLSKRTPWPRIDGYETATIDGPAESDYAQIDDMGRYLVRYHADESMGEDAKVSTWIRMMQPHTGAPEGMHFPLRKGTEVLVAFLGGDPDRPVILGAVPNAVTPSVVTKSNHTQNRLFTGGGTTLEIEDKAGGQYVHWYTPVDHTHFHMGAPRKVKGKDAPEHATKASLGWSTDGSAVLSVGGEWDIGVGAKLHEIVKGEVVEEYKTSRKETVNGPVTEQYDGDHKLTVDKQQTYVIKTGKDDTISKGWKQTITGGWEQREISGAWTQTKITGGWAQPSISGGWTQTITGGWTQNLTGDFTQIVTGGEHRTITADQMQVVAGNSTLVNGGSILQIIGGGQTIIAPSLKTLGAAWQQIDASSDDIKGVATSVVGFDLSIKGIEYGVKGVEIAGKLAELSDKVFEASLVGVSISRTGFENTNEAASFTMGGVYMKIKGLLGIT